MADLKYMLTGLSELGFVNRPCRRIKGVPNFYMFNRVFSIRLKDPYNPDYRRISVRKIQDKKLIHILRYERRKLGRPYHCMTYSFKFDKYRLKGRADEIKNQIKNHENILLEYLSQFNLDYQLTEFLFGNYINIPIARSKSAAKI